MSERQFKALNIAVLTVSDTRTEAEDLSGKLIQERIISTGHYCTHKKMAKDDIYTIRAIVSTWIADPEIDAIITTGGTGITGRDGTPEAVQPLLDKTIEGYGEMFRALSFQEIGTSTLQSRTIAGVANRTFIFCLPGSSGACRLAWDKLIALQLDNRTLPCNLVMLMPRLDEK